MVADPNRPHDAKTYKPNWEASHHPARLEEDLGGGVVRCHLSPRQCKMTPGKAGFCGVRMNVDGRLVTLNYGRATHITQESIETEAVFHYAPGAPILSLGNVGCMMNCDYCHNWKTSQARLVSSKDVRQYTPEQVVDIALQRNIPVISWTYNDPVVWHEFVLDTSRLARQHGLRNLFKSAFYISLEGAAELCEVIDIFSVSIKSMDPDWYRRITKGSLEPVLEATKFVFDQGKHVEVSMLLVTDANDKVEDTRRLADWVLTNLSDTVPIHYVRFHPDYKYTHVGRTPIERLVAAREAALEMGVKYCYLGNVYDSDAVHTYCTGCGSRLIERYGLNAHMVGLDDEGRCLQCREPLIFKPLDFMRPALMTDLGRDLAMGGRQRREFLWHGDIRSLHVEAQNNAEAAGPIFCRRLNPDPGHGSPQEVRVGRNESYRFILSKSHPDETGVEIFSPAGFEVKLFEVYDRAHYPTIDIDTAEMHGLNPVADRVPLPLYERPPRPSLSPSPGLRVLEDV
ncbi:MAG TPA: AmmeMemoRadiSam system radical SAM enzyme [Thermoanaerobaculia bacterium]|nr:AmmeMemoRadiSam system radical SAM enzyme [Thermoanaerobaculia bacterium]